MRKYSLSETNYPEDSAFIPKVKMAKDIKLFFDSLEIPNVRNRIRVLYARGKGLSTKDRKEAKRIWTNFMNKKIKSIFGAPKNIIEHHKKLLQDGSVTRALE